MHPRSRDRRQNPHVVGADRVDQHRPPPRRALGPIPVPSHLHPRQRLRGAVDRAAAQPFPLGQQRFKIGAQEAVSNGLDIRRYLATEHGVKVATTGRKYPVDPTAIRDAIARRDATHDPDRLGTNMTAVATRRCGNVPTPRRSECSPTGRRSSPGSSGFGPASTRPVHFTVDFISAAQSPASGLARPNEVFHSAGSASLAAHSVRCVWTRAAEDRIRKQAIARVAGRPATTTATRAGPEPEAGTGGDQARTMTTGPTTRRKEMIGMSLTTRTLRPPSGRG